MLTALSRASMNRNRATIWRGLFTLLVLAASTTSAGIHPDAERLSLSEARLYMVELINQDRASKGLKPVRLDETASAAGQRHAEEMAVHNYLSHWNRQGMPPDQRYTEQGGTDCVQENVYLLQRYREGELPTGTLALDPAPTFTRRELEEIEAAYFNERPPHDGHRRNILNPHHTHVGIGLARAHQGDRASTLANTQEFVNRYVEVETIPQRTRVGQEITVRGRMVNGAKFRSVALGRTPLPSPMTPTALRRTRSYRTPRPFVIYWPEPYISPRPVQVTPNGGFRVEIPLADEDRRPGLYYVTVWARTEEGQNVLASQRTVVVD